MDDYEEEKRDNSYFNFGFGVRHDWSAQPQYKNNWQDDVQDEDIVKNFQGLTRAGSIPNTKSIKVNIGLVSPLMVAVVVWNNHHYFNNGEVPNINKY